MSVTPHADSASIGSELSPDTVPFGTGPPTREELLVYYPAKFTFQQLKTFVNSGYVYGPYTDTLAFGQADIELEILAS